MKLKKCPFCGGTAELKKMDEILGTKMSEPYYISCTVCYAGSRFTENEDSAAEFWNQRADDGGREMD